jgi:hypothetical protein
VIAAGHPPAAAWSYTPRELVGWVALIADEQRRAAAENLSLGAMAARGDPKRLEALVKELSR